METTVCEPGLNRTLSTLVAAGEDTDSCLRAVARTVAAFHAHAVTPPATATCTAEALQRLWSATTAEMQPFIGSLLDADLMGRIDMLPHRYLDGRADLLQHRIDGGWIREGHGGLLADDIHCTGRHVRILDRMALDDRLHCGDVLADLAVLAVDLERLGRPDLGARFLQEYSRYSGEHHPATLAHHYLACRAHGRAAAACLRHARGDPNAQVEARRLLDIAFTHTERARVVLMLVGGLPGAGKSTLAGTIGEVLGWTVLCEEIHGPGGTAATYAELLIRAETLLRLGEPVILDATWHEARWREVARLIARRTRSDLVEIRCDTPLEVATQRLAEHAADSAALVAVAERMAAEADRWPSASSIDTTRPPASTVAAAMRAIAQSAVHPHHPGPSCRRPQGTAFPAPSLAAGTSETSR